MNEPAPVSVRDDGYRQDLASQWVASAVEAAPGERVLDLCAHRAASHGMAANPRTWSLRSAMHRARLIRGVAGGRGCSGRRVTLIAFDKV